MGGTEGKKISSQIIRLEREVLLIGRARKGRVFQLKGCLKMITKTRKVVFHGRASKKDRKQSPSVYSQTHK